MMIPSTEEMRNVYASVQALGIRSGPPGAIEYNHGKAKFDAWLAAIEREAAARARGEAIIETVQAHRDLHKTYGSTVACRGGIGGQALTSHCGEICYNADAHQKEMEAWQKLEVEAIEYSCARAEAYRQEREEQ